MEGFSPWELSRGEIPEPHSPREEGESRGDSTEVTQKMRSFLSPEVAFPSPPGQCKCLREQEITG